MKKIYLFAAMAAMLASCSSDDLTVEKQAVQQAADDGAINFSAYLNRGTTRAGAVGTLSTDGSSITEATNASLQTTGFGVFGYYTNNELYSEASKPNFFFNQKVEGADWHYSPIKYWPNEYGTGAISDAQDKLTFFAYAPWVEVEPSTGLLKDQSGNKNSSGIVALTRNTASGDPYVKYYVDMDPENRVDLCWGVAAADFNESVEGDLNSNIKGGKVYKDVSKPKVSSKIKFDFNHALASLNVQIDADIDQEDHGTNPLAAETKIFVRSVTFEGFASKGMFNLNAEKTQPKWYDLTGINELTNGKVTIYDGRRDGSEGQVNADASNETPKDLNPTIIQDYASVLGEFSASAGVPTAAPVNLFAGNNLTEPIYVIPTNEQLKVTIVYDVETKDDNLATYLSDGKTKGSSVENTITKPITITSSGAELKLAAGLKYIVKLHLGMTSVKFDAFVTGWDPGDDGEPWLPINNNSIAAGGTLSTSIGAAGGTYAFTFTGAADGAVTVTSDPADYVTGSGTGASGSAPVTLTISPNATVTKKDPVVVTVTDQDSKTVTVNISQAAKPFVFASPTAITNSQTDIVITANTTDGGSATDAQWSAATVTVEKYNTGTSKWDTMEQGEEAGKYTYAGGTQQGTITLKTAAATDEQYRITVKIGDADPVTTDPITVGS